MVALADVLSVTDTSCHSLDYYNIFKSLFQMGFITLALLKLNPVQKVGHGAVSLFTCNMLINASYKWVQDMANQGLRAVNQANSKTATASN